MSSSASAGRPRPVTIVVPVYGDLPSLLACVESLARTVDLGRHRVLLVNDDGPDADEIETALLAAIEGREGFVYARNETNLGFVGNCNRAVLERDDTDNDILLLNSDTVTTAGFLEALIEALYDDPRNGAVCARSDNATIASLPFKLRSPAGGRSPERSLAVHGAVRDLLPRYSVAPVAMGFCLLLRRDLIRRFGLFDEAFAPGYGEENDFCLRIAAHGYRSLIAHRALVFHGVGKSFSGPRRDGLRAAHEKLLVRRYPQYTEAVQRYLYRDRDPVDVFADAFEPGDGVTKVLIDVDLVPARDLPLLEAADTAARTGTAEVTVVLPRRGLAARRSLRRLSALTFVAPRRVDGLWDIALVGDATPARNARANRSAPRWASRDGLPANGQEALDALLALGREPIDVAALRGRWNAVADAGFVRGFSAPVEAAHRRALRRLHRLAPRATSRARGALRVALGRG